MNRASIRRASNGFTLIELLVAMAIGILIMAGLAGVVSSALASRDQEQGRRDATDAAGFALARMSAAIGGTTRLMVPRHNTVTTLWNEALRNPGVLAVALDHRIDRDHNGIADADNDGDGRIDEDPSGDLTNDGVSGIIGIDDDNDGLTDELHISVAPAEDDDDEDGLANEDGWNGSDDDGDGLVDEDTKKDATHDTKAGVIGVDDDGDTLIDEGDKNDDDEDGAIDEDWVDTVVYFKSGTNLIERMPNLAPTSGTDYTERVIASKISSFQVERLSPSARGVLVEITLGITAADGSVMSFTTRARVGGQL